MSDNYTNPWREKEARKIAAAERTEHMEKEFSKLIANCAKNTRQYFPPTDNYHVEPRYAAQYGVLPKIVVLQMDSVSAAFHVWKGEKGLGKIAILDFASYKNPGGMFLEGSIAQEEALCHASYLYNVLSSPRLVKEFYEPNRSRLNKSLYHSNLLYVPGVFFEKPVTVEGSVMSGCFDVIVCAAPNKGAAQKYQNVPDEVCDGHMRHRIRMILAVAEKEKVNTLILGAFGCGVFKNDPATVARIFREELRGRPYTVVFAVPGEKFDVFRSVFPE